MDDRKRCILVVDDEPDLRDAIAFEFRRKGFEVVTAGSGNEAFGIVLNRPVDVVLSDVRMANGTGIELLDKIKDRDVFSPVVMLITGFADMALEDAYNKGAEAVFPKPFNRKALFDAVQKSIEGPEARNSRRSGRTETSLPIAMKFLESDFSVQTVVKNIGRGGTFCLLSNRFPHVGESVEFHLETSIPQIPTITGRGIVRWVRDSEREGLPLGCGIEFESLSDETQMNVTQLVNFLKTRSYNPRA